MFCLKNTISIPSLPHLSFHTLFSDDLTSFFTMFIIPVIPCKLYIIDFRFHRRYPIVIYRIAV